MPNSVEPEVDSRSTQCAREWAHRRLVLMVRCGGRHCAPRRRESQDALKRMPNAPGATMTVAVSAAKTAAMEAATATSEMTAMATQMPAAVAAMTAAMTASTHILDPSTVDIRREGRRDARRHGWSIRKRHRIGRPGRGREQHGAHDETQGASGNKSYLHHLYTSLVLEAEMKSNNPALQLWRSCLFFLEPPDRASDRRHHRSGRPGAEPSIRRRRSGLFAVATPTATGGRCTPRPCERLKCI